MNESQRRAWEALGLGPRWRRRDAAGADASMPEPQPEEGGDRMRPVPEAAAGEPAVVGEFKAVAGGRIAAAAAVAGPSSPASVALMDWDALRAAVADCRACGLSGTRSRTVFGTGPDNAKWLLIGEAPGAEEDARGEPFVGQAGRLLDNMLAAVGLARERDVFIANVLKCRPPRNRDPLPEEVACCEPYLARQVELLSPRIIVVMGRFAAQSVLRTDASIANLRGKRHAYQAGERRIPVIVTYHPAYLLRNLGDKAKAWSDLCLARDTFEAACADATDR